MSDHYLIRRGDALMVATELALGRIQIDDVSDALHRLPAVDVAGVREEAVQAEREAIAAMIEAIIEEAKMTLTPAQTLLMPKVEQDVLAMLAAIVAAIRARKGGAA
jgi:sulfite reductase beta subunit-like hemoprotein